MSDTDSWTQRLDSAQTLLDWFKTVCQHEGMHGLKQAFAHVARTPYSVREYWLQLQLQYMLARDFTSERSGWFVLEREPPVVFLHHHQPHPQDFRYGKWPDLLDFRRRPDHFCWWELKWISGEDKLRRFIADAWLISDMDVEYTAARHGDETKDMGLQLGNLCGDLGYENSQRADLAETLKNATHTVVSLAILDENMMDLVDEAEGGGVSWPRGKPLLPGKGDFPSAFEQCLKNLPPKDPKQPMPQAGLAKSELRLEGVQVGLLAWIQRIWTKEQDMRGVQANRGRGTR